MTDPDLTLAELHARLIRYDEKRYPPLPVAIPLLRAGLGSSDDYQATLALEAMVSIDTDERAWWQMGNPGQPAAHWYRKVLKVLRDDWHRAALAARDAHDPDLREAARASLELLEPKA